MIFKGGQRTSKGHIFLLEFVSQFDRDVIRYRICTVIVWNGSPRFHVHAECIVYCKLSLCSYTQYDKENHIRGFFFIILTRIRTTIPKKKRKRTSWELTGSSRHDVKEHKFPIRSLLSTTSLRPVSFDYHTRILRVFVGSGKILIIIFTKMKCRCIFCKYNGMRRVLSIFYLSLHCTSIFKYLKCLSAELYSIIFCRIVFYIN